MTSHPVPATCTVRTADGAPAEADLLTAFRRLTPAKRAAVMRMVARDNAGVPFKESLAELRRDFAS